MVFRIFYHTGGCISFIAKLFFLKRVNEFKEKEVFSLHYSHCGDR